MAGSKKAAETFAERIDHYGEKLMRQDFSGMDIPALDKEIEALSGDPQARGGGFQGLRPDARAKRVAMRVLLARERWQRVPAGFRTAMTKKVRKLCRKHCTRGGGWQRKKRRRG